jgi:hypothetical protein
LYDEKKGGGGGYERNLIRRGAQVIASCVAASKGDNQWVSSLSCPFLAFNFKFDAAVPGPGRRSPLLSSPSCRHCPVSTASLPSLQQCLHFRSLTASINTTPQSPTDQ